MRKGQTLRPLGLGFQPPLVYGLEARNLSRGTGCWGPEPNAQSFTHRITSFLVSAGLVLMP